MLALCRCVISEVCPDGSDSDTPTQTHPRIHRGLSSRATAYYWGPSGSHLRPTWASTKVTNPMLTLCSEVLFRLARDMLQARTPLNLYPSVVRHGGQSSQRGTLSRGGRMKPYQRRPRSESSSLLDCLKCVLSLLPLTLILPAGEPANFRTAQRPGDVQDQPSTGLSRASMSMYAGTNYSELCS